MRGRSSWGPWAAGVALMTPLLLASAVLVPREPERVEAAGASAARMSPVVAVVDSVARSATRRAPFRVDGRPAPVPYDPVAVDPAAAPDRSPRPTLVLTGIAGGQHPLVVIGGIPGREGPVLLAVGDTAGGLRVRRVAGGAVTVTGMDTTWTLHVKGAQ